jgi:cytochrome c biogenesis protein CcdA
VRATLKGGTDIMSLRGIDLLRVGLVLIFGGISVWLTITLLDNLTGWLILIIGFAVGVVGTELYYVPRFREKWQRIGIPGYEKTKEQQEATELEKDNDNRQIIWIVVVGVTGAAVLRNYLSPQLQNVITVALLSGIVGCLLRFILLIYGERAKLEQN